MRLMLCGFLMSLAAACVSAPTSSYAELRAGIAVDSNEQSGVRTASSRAVAEIEVDRSGLHGGIPGFFDSPPEVYSNTVRREFTMFVVGEVAGDGVVSVKLMSEYAYPIGETELKNKPFEPEELPGDGFIGWPSRPTKWDWIYREDRCENGRLNCGHYWRREMRLSDADLAYICDLPAGSRFRVGYGSSVSNLMPRDEVVATLDALGIADRYRTAAHAG